MNKYLLALGGISILLMYGILLWTPKPVEQTETPVAEMQIEVVDTEAAREQGLSGRTDVPDNYGMLFVFETKDRYSFWMKDMLVPIDIIWLADDGSIVEIEDSVSPDTYPNSFTAPTPVKYVLETRARYARDNGWGIGTNVPIELP
ncbi:DUF192 domain-containing protein [Patescibacteria group bacterium]|nr:DUF192 domain-containing protein [Patescibacteria group bacterium]MBU1755275.1 DUF192 domain-containing protein [Patescibacteria group bacterium]